MDSFKREEQTSRGARSMVGSSASFFNTSGQSFNGSEWLKGSFVFSGVPATESSVRLILTKGDKFFRAKSKLLDQADAILDKAEKSDNPEEFKDSFLETMEELQVVNRQIPERWLKRHIGLLIEGAGDPGSSEDDDDDEKPLPDGSLFSLFKRDESSYERDKHRQEASRMVDSALHANKFNNVMSGRMQKLVTSATSVLYQVQEAESTPDKASLERCVKMLNEGTDEVGSRIAHPSNQKFFKDVKGRMKAITDLLLKRDAAKE